MSFPNTPIMLPNVQNHSIFFIYIFNVLPNNTPIMFPNVYNHSNYSFTCSMSFLAPLSYLPMSKIIEFLQKKIFRIFFKKINQFFAWFLIPLLSFLAFLSYLPIYSSVSPPFFFNTQPTLWCICHLSWCCCLSSPNVLPTTLIGIYHLLMSFLASLSCDSS
jgi:hypothetical protein